MPTTVRGHGRSGRLVVDVPTDLPEGSEVELVTIADVVEIHRAADDQAKAPVDAMLARWRAQDVSAEPDWDVSEIPPFALRPHAP